MIEAADTQHSKVTMSVTMSVTPVVCCNALHPCYMSVMMGVTRVTLIMSVTLMNGCNENGCNAIMRLTLLLFEKTLSAIQVSVSTRDTNTVHAWPHCHNTPQRRRTHKTMLSATTRRRGGYTYQREGP